VQQNCGFAHDAGALRFDGFFDGAEQGCHLLVQLAFDDQGHHFAFARGQAGDQRRADNGAQPFGVERLEQEIEKRIAVLMTDGVEQIEYTSPRAFLEERGALVTLVSPKAAGEQIQGKNGDNLGATFPVALSVDDAQVNDFEGLLLPGGKDNPAALRKVRQPLPSSGVLRRQQTHCCHLPRALALIDAGLADSRHLTSVPTVQDELRDAGAEWTDDEVFIKDKLVTSHKPDDLSAFNSAFLQTLQVAISPDTGPSS
jgi:protease I